MLKIIDVIGQLVTPQKTETSPRDAPNDGFNPIRLPKVFPKVAPMKNTGTISPPLKPAPRVIAVNKIFKAKDSGRA